MADRNRAGRNAVPAAVGRQRSAPGAAGGLAAAILDTISNLVVVLDRQGRIVAFNRACERATGYTFPEVAGREVFDLFLLPEEVDSVRAAFRQLVAGQFPDKHENYWLTKSGERRLIAWLNSASLDAQGAVEFVVSTGTDVSEQRRAEQALRQSEERWRRLTELSPVGVFQTDVRGDCLYVNERWCAMAGLSPAEAMGKGWVKALHPDDREQVAAQWYQAADSGGKFALEYRFRTPQGKVTWLFGHAVALRDDRGAVTGYIGTVSDITKRKRAEEALRESEERLRLFIENAPAAIAMFDRDLRYLAASHRWLTDYGLEGRDVVGLSHYEVFPEITEGWKAIHRRALAGEIVRAAEDRFPRIDGTVQWLRWEVRPWHRADGAIGGIAMFTEEISERKQAEAERERLLGELRETNKALILSNLRVRDGAAATEAQRLKAQQRAAELEATIDSIVDGVLVYNAEGRVTMVNKFARQLLGLTDSAELRLAAADIPRAARLRHLDGRTVAPDETASARALAGQIIAGQSQIGYNWQSGRDVHLRTSAAPIRDDRGQITGAAVVVRDVTDLMELDRLKDQFILVAAHELKTPVAIMKGYAQALLRGVEEASPRRRKMLDAIDRGADRIEGVVNDLLDIAKLQEERLELARERVDLTELAEEVADRLALSAPRHQLRVKTMQPAIVQGDRARLEQVLVNLLDNAIRYSPAGGEIGLAVAVRNHEAVVSVSDRGVGIPAEKQVRIFQRFYRAHTGTPYDYGGMGVGLYISQEIVERHGGKMWFESAEGQGSTFSFCLPLRRQGDEG